MCLTASPAASTVEWRGEVNPHRYPTFIIMLLALSTALEHGAVPGVVRHGAVGRLVLLVVVGVIITGFVPVQSSG